jgi:putative protease
LEAQVKEVGRVKHFYPKINVAVVELTAPVKVGDSILIRGATTNVEQSIDSMQIEHESVQSANAGQSIGLKVKDRVRENDLILRKAG